MKAIQALDEKGQRLAEVGLALAVVFVIALLVVPLPPVVLDLFLALSIGLSIVVLLVALYTTDPLEFSAFPMMLLLLTLFRLALNVSSTRLILAKGEAGAVIHAFGEFVIGGNYAVGIVLFLILIGINFIVITKGAGRVAEVAARFTLDAMPGKQMAIDADLSAGLIDERQARMRRDEITRQADFYGAMDGSSKFVKGRRRGGAHHHRHQRARRDLRGRRAARHADRTRRDHLHDPHRRRRPRLADPGARHLDRRGHHGHPLGPRVAHGAHARLQLGQQPRAMWITAGVLASFGLVPGLPSFPFLALAAGAAMLARVSAKGERRRADAAVIEDAQAAAGPVAEADPMRDLLQIDPIELEVGYAVIPLVTTARAATCSSASRCCASRPRSSSDAHPVGAHPRRHPAPRQRVRDQAARLRDRPREVMPRFLMALDTGGVVAPIDGMDTVDPSSACRPSGSPPPAASRPSRYGYVVWSPSTVVATHLMEMLKARRRAARPPGRAGDGRGAQEEPPRARGRHRPRQVSLGILHRILQRLLRERIPIRDLVTILEAVGDAADQTKDPGAAHRARAPRPHPRDRAPLHRRHRRRARRHRGPARASLMGLLAPRDAAQTHGLSLLTPTPSPTSCATSTCSRAPTPPTAAPCAHHPAVAAHRHPPPHRARAPGVPVVSLAELPAHREPELRATWELPNAA
jgi:flagellar biosynthesis protein FlhA